MNFAPEKKVTIGQSAVVGIYLLSLVLFVLGSSYASVPLYQLFCQSTGFGGTVQVNHNYGATTQSILLSQEASTHPITINFNADSSNDLPWKCKPMVNHIQVLPGDTALTSFIAHNLSDHPITGVSIYHVTPAKVGIYFNKIQCFCFEEQRLKAHEHVELPILFFLDSEFSQDPMMQDITSITLSYTFFRSDSSF